MQKKNEIELTITGIDIKKECIEVAQKRSELANAHLVVSDYRDMLFNEKMAVLFSTFIERIRGITGDTNLWRMN